jgi:hypothetical protein
VCQHHGRFIAHAMSFFSNGRLSAPEFCKKGFFPCRNSLYAGMRDALTTLRPCTDASCTRGGNFCDSEFNVGRNLVSNWAGRCSGSWRCLSNNGVLLLGASVAWILVSRIVRIPKFQCFVMMDKAIGHTDTTLRLLSKCARNIVESTLPCCK